MFKHYFIPAEPRGDWSPEFPASKTNINMGHLMEEFQQYAHQSSEKNIQILATLFLKSKVGTWNTLGKKLQKKLQKRLINQYVPHDAKECTTALFPCEKCGHISDHLTQCTHDYSSDENVSDKEEKELQIRVEQNTIQPFDTSKVAEKIRESLTNFEQLTEFEEEKTEQTCYGCKNNQANQLAHICLEDGAMDPIFTFTFTTEHLVMLISTIKTTGIQLEEDTDDCFVVSSVDEKYLL